MTAAQLLQLATDKHVWNLSSYRCPNSPTTTDGKGRCVTSCGLCGGRNRMSDAGHDPLPVTVDVRGVDVRLETVDDVICAAVGDPCGLAFVRDDDPHPYWAAAHDALKAARATVKANGYSPDSKHAKRCSKCGKTKRAAEFHRNRSREDGRQSSCKPCWSAARADRTPEQVDHANRRRRKNDRRRAVDKTTQAYVRAA